MQPSNKEQQLRCDVEQIAGTIGERNVYRYPKLMEAAEFIETSFRESGLEPKRQEYRAAGHIFANVELDIPGRTKAREIVVVGAHYDTERGSPGADDNGSGIAAVLALSRSFAQKTSSRTLRLVAFANEERPFLRTENMGSRVYARACRERGDRIVGMLSLEMLGCCRNEPNSQWLSFYGMWYPARGNFLLLVSNPRSRVLLHHATAAFRRNSVIGCETITLPGFLPGARSSDHWSFWKENFPALMLTDTARLRYRHYHRRSDTPDKLQYGFLAEAVRGVSGIIDELVR